MKLKLYFLLMLISIFIFSCRNDDDNGLAPSTSVNDFVWKALNLWYYWQSDVQDLADNRFSNDTDYSEFLNSKETEELFYSLLYNYGTTDRFSWIVEDYHDLENSFAGVNVSYGMDYGLVYVSENSENIFGYVQYVLPGSPASEAGLKRGDIFTRINDIQLNSSNYSELLGANSATFGMADMQNGTIYNTDEQITLSKTQIEENPVYLTSVITEDTKKIGYMVYNGFRANYNDELNDAIAELKAQGITDFVLDLRYNGGGSVQTSSYLGSMITGQFTDDTFTQLTFNSKTSSNNSTYKFENTAKMYNDSLEETGTFPLEHLQLSKLYVLTTKGTASASEMLISCLRPYMEVVTIGTTTYGKTVGSITLYDSPSNYYTSTEGINTTHTWAMQPIVFDYKNSINQSSSTQGITPDESINEIQYLEGMLPLGNPQEVVLAKAIELITGGLKVAEKMPKNGQNQLLNSSQIMQRFGTEMYLDKDFDSQLSNRNKR